MKKFRNLIFIGTFSICIIIFLVYSQVRNNQYELIEYKNNEIDSIKEETEEINNIVIHITGEVNNPGVITLKEGERIIDAIEKAGGPTQEADTSKVNLAYILSDGQKIDIPSIYDNETESYIAEDSGNCIIENFEAKININTATQNELETLTGIGPSMASKIINYRKEHGKFKKIEEIKNVPGIGEAKYNAIKDNICV